MPAYDHTLAYADVIRCSVTALLELTMFKHTAYSAWPVGSIFNTSFSFLGPKIILLRNYHTSYRAADENPVTATFLYPSTFSDGGEL